VLSRFPIFTKVGEKVWFSVGELARWAVALLTLSPNSSPYFEGVIKTSMSEQAYIYS